MWNQFTSSPSSMASRIFQMDVSDKFSEDLHDLLNIHNEVYKLSGY